LTGLKPAIACLPSTYRNPIKQFISNHLNITSTYPKGKQTNQVYAGSEITVNLLQAEPEQEGIPANVVNEYEESNFRGFSTGAPYSADI